MKGLILKSDHYQYLEKSFKEWLYVLGYAQGTIYNLPLHVRELFYYLEQNNINHITELDNELIKSHYDSLKLRSNIRRGGALSKASLNKHIQAFYKFTEYLRQSGRLLLPMLDLDWESDDTAEIEVLSQEEVQMLYKATYGFHENTKWEPFSARDRAILTVFYGCGLRRNEGYHLDLSDIDLDRRILHVRKGKANKERFVPFNKTNAKYLQDYIYDSRPQINMDKTNNAFFISQRGVRMNAQSMALRLKLLQQRTEDIQLQQKTVRLHVMRHSIATHLLQNGMPLGKISRFLGHTSLESTQIYTHLVEEQSLNE
jgi:integrase/recombinase XerD